MHLPGGHGLLLVVLAETSGFRGDACEGVADEGVEDGHGSLGDSGVRVDLLEDAVDVDVVGFSAPAFVLLAWFTSSPSSFYLLGVFLFSCS